MIRLAVCDDEPLDLQNIKMMLSDYLREHSESGITVTSFHSADELLKRIESERFHIYLLDILMDGKNGIQVGEMIRRKDQKAAIIFLTISPDYAVASYTVDAFYYLLKPLNKETFEPVLERAIRDFKGGPEECLVIRTKLGTVSVRSSHIMYVEYHSHTLTYHLTNGTCVDSLTIRTSFDKGVEPLLENTSFVKISASFIVNLTCVKSITGKGFLMPDGTKLNITRTYTEAKQRYLEYMINGGRKPE